MGQDNCSSIIYTVTKISELFLEFMNVREGAIVGLKGCKWVSSFGVVYFKAINLSAAQFLFP